MKPNNLVLKFRNYIPVAAAAISSAFFTTSAYALAWPPTAADMTTAFADMGENIGVILMAVVAAGLVLYGGVVAVMAAIRFFSKFIKQTQAA